MKLRHPLTGAIYTTRDAGHVDVEDRNGRPGVVRRDGPGRKGALRAAGATAYGGGGPRFARRTVPRFARRGPRFARPG